MGITIVTVRFTSVHTNLVLKGVNLQPSGKIIFLTTRFFFSERRDNKFDNVTVLESVYILLKRTRMPEPIFSQSRRTLPVIRFES